MTAHLADRDSVNAWDLDLFTFDRPAWWADAACRGGVRDEATGQPVDFFVGRGESDAPAKAVCRRCPVREACLAHALATDQRYGVWGGLSERERRRIQNARPDRLAARRARVAQLSDEVLHASDIAKRMGLTLNIVWDDLGRRDVGVAG